MVGAALVCLIALVRAAVISANPEFNVGYFLKSEGRKILEAKKLGMDGTVGSIYGRARCASFVDKNGNPSQAAVWLISNTDYISNPTVMAAIITESETPELIVGPAQNWQGHFGYGVTLQPIIEWDSAKREYVLSFIDCSNRPGYEGVWLSEVRGTQWQMKKCKNGEMLMANVRLGQPDDFVMHGYVKEIGRKGAYIFRSPLACVPAGDSFWEALVLVVLDIETLTFSQVAVENMFPGRQSKWEDPYYSFCLDMDHKRVVLVSREIFNATVNPQKIKYRYVWIPFSCNIWRNEVAGVEVPDSEKSWASKYSDIKIKNPNIVSYQLPDPVELANSRSIGGASLLDSWYVPTEERGKTRQVLFYQANTGSTYAIRTTSNGFYSNGYATVPYMIPNDWGLTTKGQTSPNYETIDMSAQTSDKFAMRIIKIEDQEVNEVSCDPVNDNGMKINMTFISELDDVTSLYDDTSIMFLGPPIYGPSGEIILCTYPIWFAYGCKHNLIMYTMTIRQFTIKDEPVQTGIIERPSMEDNEPDNLTEYLDFTPSIDPNKVPYEQARPYMMGQYMSYAFDTSIYGTRPGTKVYAQLFGNAYIGQGWGEVGDLHLFMNSPVSSRPGFRLDVEWSKGEEPLLVEHKKVLQLTRTGLWFMRSSEEPWTFKVAELRVDNESLIQNSYMRIVCPRVKAVYDMIYNTRGVSIGEATGDPGVSFDSQARMATFDLKSKAGRISLGPDMAGFANASEYEQNRAYIEITGAPNNANRPISFSNLPDEVTVTYYAGLAETAATIPFVRLEADSKQKLSLSMPGSFFEWPAMNEFPIKVQPPANFEITLDSVVPICFEFQRSTTTTTVTADTITFITSESFFDSASNRVVIKTESSGSSAVLVEVGVKQIRIVSNGRSVVFTPQSSSQVTIEHSRTDLPLIVSLLSEDSSGRLQNLSVKIIGGAKLFVDSPVCGKTEQFLKVQSDATFTVITSDGTSPSCIQSTTQFSVETASKDSVKYPSRPAMRNRFCLASDTTKCSGYESAVFTGSDLSRLGEHIVATSEPFVLYVPDDVILTSELSFAGLPKASVSIIGSGLIKGTVRLPAGFTLTKDSLSETDLIVAVDSNHSSPPSAKTDTAPRSLRIELLNLKGSVSSYVIVSIRSGIYPIAAIVPEQYETWDNLLTFRYDIGMVMNNRAIKQALAAESVPESDLVAEINARSTGYETLEVTDTSKPYNINLDGINRQISFRVIGKVTTDAAKPKVILTYTATTPSKIKNLVFQNVIVGFNPIPSVSDLKLNLDRVELGSGTGIAEEWKHKVSCDNLVGDASALDQTNPTGSKTFVAGEKLDLSSLGTTSGKFEMSSDKLDLADATDAQVNIELKPSQEGKNTVSIGQLRDDSEVKMSDFTDLHITIAEANAPVAVSKVANLTIESSVPPTIKSVSVVGSGVSTISSNQVLTIKEVSFDEPSTNEKRSISVPTTSGSVIAKSVTVAKNNNGQIDNVIISDQLSLSQGAQLTVDNCVLTSNPTLSFEGSSIGQLPTLVLTQSSAERFIPGACNVALSGSSSANLLSDDSASKVFVQGLLDADQCSSVKSVVHLPPSLIAECSANGKELKVARANVDPGDQSNAPSIIETGVTEANPINPDDSKDHGLSAGGIAGIVVAVIVVVAAVVVVAIVMVKRKNRNRRSDPAEERKQSIVEGAPIENL